METFRTPRPRYDGLAVLREAAAQGLSIRELARRAERTQPTVRRFISGIGQTVETARGLARALGHETPAHWFLGFEGEEGEACVRG